ncbi:hypothetical protein [Streptomyces sp. NPDC002588]|uniref:hypothetical protein n=1 Tax=Streptomyces sp. NPDC002588 TaxID=3154419 RepID=UPI00332DEAC3
MSVVAGCAQRRRLRHEVSTGRIARRRGTTVHRSVRHGVAGVAATSLVYVGLLLVSADNQHLFGDGWMASAAETAHPYGTAVVDGWATFSRTTTHALARMETFAAWPLTALTMLWLASRDQAVYVRTAVALFLSNATGLVVFASLRGFPADETTLVRDYLALPGVRAGWYLLMALVVVSTSARLWRGVATAVALSAGTAAVLTADGHLLGTLSAMSAPLLAWYAATPLHRGRAVRRRRAMHPSGGTVPEGDVVSLRPRTEVSEDWSDSEPVRLRQAG